MVARQRFCTRLPGLWESSQSEYVCVCYMYSSFCQRYSGIILIYIIRMHGICTCLLAKRSSFYAYIYSVYTCDSFRFNIYIYVLALNVKNAWKYMYLACNTQYTLLMYCTVHVDTWLTLGLLLRHCYTHR